MFDLQSILNGNQFLSGGLALGVAGGAVYGFKKYLLRWWSWLWSQCTIEVEVRNTDPPFDWLLHWLDQQPYSKRARRLTVSIEASGDDNEPRVRYSEAGEPSKPKLIFSPAVGHHFFLYRGRLLWLHRDRNDQPQQGGFSRQIETFTATMFGRSQELLRGLLEDAYETYAKLVRRQARIFMSQWDHWYSQGFIRPRTLESVVMPGGQKEQLLHDVQTFLGAESWYHGMGIPYRRGYLLQGVSGSGKTSLIVALASELRIPLYVLSLASVASDNELSNLLQNIGSPRAIILFEDVDSVKAARSREAEDKKDSGPGDRVTVGGLLNALDGVASRDGYITVMTTNRRDTLEPALTRPGRIDFELVFGYATQEQAGELYRRFYRQQGELGPVPEGVSMAVLQEHFLRHRDDPERGAVLDGLGKPALALKSA